MENAALTVLMLDDDASAVQDLRACLDGSDHRLRTAQNYVDFDALLTDDVSVVVIELSLRDVDGIEVLRLLSTQGFDGAVLLQSRVERRFLRAAERIGRDQRLRMLQSLQKPITKAQVLERLSQVSVRDRSVPSSDEKVARFRDADLTEAARTGQIEFFYQPVLELETGTCIAVEALARWRHPAFGLLRASQYLSSADKPAHDALRRCIYDQVFPQYADWRADGATFLLNVNLSSVCIREPQLPDTICRYADKCGLPYESLRFEITEERIADERIGAMENLIRLGLKGFSVAIDDFGTQYASLERMGRLPIDTLKLDGAFIQNALMDNDALAILESCVTLGHKLNLWVTAEGVESEDQMLLARELGCNAVQGHFLSRPRPHHRVLAEIEKAQRLCAGILRHRGAA